LKVIPVSEIDSEIVGIKNTLSHIKPDDTLINNLRFVIGFLERLKDEKAIPAIPIEKIDTRIKELHQWQKDFPSGKEWHQELIDELLELKKE
jgi:hypothetical protein